MPRSCLLTERRCSWPWSFTLSRNCCIRCVWDNDIWNVDRINYRSVGLISSASPETSFLCRAVCLRKRTWKKLWKMICKSLVLFSSFLFCFFYSCFQLDGRKFFRGVSLLGLKSEKYQYQRAPYRGNLYVYQILKNSPRRRSVHPRHAICSEKLRMWIFRCCYVSWEKRCAKSSFSRPFHGGIFSSG